MKIIKSHTFIFLSLFIALSDGSFITMNSIFMKDTLYETLENEGQQLHTSFDTLLSQTYANMLVMATFIANDEEVKSLFYQAKKAVDNEGGGAGGKQSASIRQALYNKLGPNWEKIQKKFQVRQLHFHLGPGSTSFLRVHRPDKFGDNMDNVRHTIVDTNAEHTSRSGFESGRVYSGLRGVAPVSIWDTLQNKETHVGALEVGTTFDTVLNILDKQYNIGAGILLTKKHINSAMWPDFVKRHFGDGLQGCDCFIEAFSRDGFEAIIAQAKQQSIFFRTTGSEILQINGSYYSVIHFPVRDYLGNKDPQRGAVGAAVFWKNADKQMADYFASQRFNIIFGVLSFILIELLLYFSFRFATQHLKTKVNKKTKQLQISESHLKEAQKIGKISNWEWNLQTGEVIVNEGLVELIGYTMAEISPVSIQTWKDLTHPDDLKKTEQSLQDYFDSKTDCFQTDFRIKHKQAHWVWLHNRGKITQWNKDGSPLWMSGIHIDINERKEFEQQIARAHQLIEQSLNEIYLFDKETLYFIDANHAARKNLGYTQSELSGMTPFDIKPKISRNEFIERINPLLCGTQQELIFETVHQRKDDSIYPVEVHLQLLEDEVPVFIAIIHDISVRIEKEKLLEESQLKYQRLVDDIDEQFVIFSHDGVEGLLSYVSDSLENVFGISKEDGIGHSWAKLINWLPDSIVLAESILRQQIEGSLDFIQFEMSFIHPNKQIRTIYVSQHPIRDKSGNLTAIDGIVEDISERKREQEQLRLAASVFAHSQEGILITDKNNLIVDVNPACLELTGYTREDVIGKTPSLFSAGKQTKEFYSQMWESLLGTGHWQGEIWNRKKSGEIYSERLSIDVVLGSKGGIQHFVAVFYDTTYLKEHEAELERIAYNDALTNLPNRLLLRDRMQQALSKANRGKKILAVCYLDLDGFKPVNDTYGHKVGDGILVEVAKRLLNTVRADDTVSRIGGDEFVLLMQDIDDIGELKQVLGRILAAISSDYSFAIDEKIQPINSISASIGVTLYPQDNNEADLLLRHADQSMYLAKQRGKNRYSFFDPKEEQRVSAEQIIQQEIRLALERNELRLFYQPKVNMHTGEVFGLEALIRWQHPEKGLLSPYLFLPSIENTPLIIDVGNWVLRQSLAQMRLWKTEGINLKVSVNIDSMQLQQDDFVYSLKKLLDEFNDISASTLELEILETSALQDIEHVSQVIKECTQLGVQFSLDDFGTGYSSLTYLKRLPAQTLKIDQSFIRNLLESPDDMAIIEGVLGLAHAFHRTSIAEGVETIQIGTLLLNLGCTLAQGYAIAHPMPAEELPQWLSSFQIPLPWAEAQNSLHSDANYMITLMYLNHHRIVSRVLHAIEQQTVSLIPEHFEEHLRCEIGQWLNGEGEKRYGKRKEFGIIVDKHKQLHEYIKDAVILLNNNETDKLKTVSEELKKASNEILNCLNQLRNKDAISL